MKLLIAILLCSQFMILPFSFRWCKEVSAQVLIIITICSLIWKKNKSIALFMLWSLFIFLISKSFLIKDSGNQTIYRINLPAFLNMINIVLYGLFYYVLHQIKLDKNLIYKTFCFIAIFQAIYVILQKIQLDQFFYSISLWHDEGKHLKISWPVGLWGNETLVSWCMAICSPFFLAFKELRYKIGYVLTFIAILCTEATAGLIAFVLGYIFWLFFKYRKLAIILTICILLGGIIFYRSGKFTEYYNARNLFRVWDKSIEIWKEKPLTGYGLGSYRQIFIGKAPEFLPDGHWAQTHNDYIQILFETGIIGLGFILSLMWITFYNFWKEKKGLIPITSLFIFSMIAFWGFPLHTAIGVLPFMALVLAEREL